MVQSYPTNQLKLPSFSIVVETENLSTAEMEGLTHCLDTLAAQDVSPTDANEVLIIETGDLPTDLIDRLQTHYPWLTVQRIESSIDYYEAKMKGFSFTTGEVLVLCDSDCVYEPGWLKNLLVPFAEKAEIQVVAGETRISPLGAYGLAMALTYIFPPFSQRQELSQSHSYFCNNVAFRRSFLLSHPIPANLPIYRGNCTVHACYLTEQGYVIWNQPQSRAVHAAPNGLSHFFWRFLLLGFDALTVARLQRRSGGQLNVNLLDDLRACVGIGVWKLKQVVLRTGALLSDDPTRIWLLPLAVPIALTSLLLFFSGLMIGYVSPTYLLKKYSQVEARLEHV
ncbi:glycosyltransferase family 2 protein [Oculatella sp. LEGE 06141]|uniref:glycosyltransferase family 2 protein n=1 Tax=Oculatella sp. LEGE 06141 TaxID=1828648 RepID=UPI00187FD25E|nr:glycosyltransferase family 2 protein [Oculatella sp. LEGE 06141]MBE9178313.1 glycosyltransferase family 2 protein [Oculatella sp. LEGE 06141]